MAFHHLPSLLALRAFESASRHGSMKCAAEELSVTPGAISQLVKKLEEQMGFELTRRTNRGFELTQKGITLKAGLIHAFSALNEATEAVRPKLQTQNLKFACSPPFAASWLVPRLQYFIEEHPNLEIQVCSSFTKINYNAEDIDIGVRLSNDDTPSFNRQWLGEETMVVLASPNFIKRHKLVEPRDILRVPLLSEDNSNYFPNCPGWPEWFHAVGLPSYPHHRSVVNFGKHVDQALDAAVAGTGVILGRKVLASNDIQAGRLVCPFGPELNCGSQYQIVSAKETLLSDAAKAFRDWLEKEIAASLKTGFKPESLKLSSIINFPKTINTQ